MKKQCRSQSPDTGFGISSCYNTGHHNRTGRISDVLRRRVHAEKRKRMAVAAIFLSVLTVLSAFEIRTATVQATDTPAPSMDVNLNEYSQLAASSNYYAWRGIVNLTGSIPEPQLTAEFISCYIDDYVLPVFTIEKPDIPLSDSVYSLVAVIDTAAYAAGYHHLTFYNGSPAAGDGSNILWSVEAYFTQSGYATIINVATTVNMRKEPNTLQSPVTSVKYNEIVEIFEQVKGQSVTIANTTSDMWYKVKYKSVDDITYNGYIFSYYLLPTSIIDMVKISAEGSFIETFSVEKSNYTIYISNTVKELNVNSVVKSHITDELLIKFNGSNLNILPDKFIFNDGKNEIIFSITGLNNNRKDYTFTFLRIPDIIESAFQFELAKFPESYKDNLLELHSQFPYWTFKAESFDNVLDWNNAVNSQDSGTVSLISKYSLTEYKKDDIIKDGTEFVTASRAAVEYYLDPRNFLNEKNIFMFEQLSYNAVLHTLEGITKIIAGTGLAGREQMFLDAGVISNVSPYHLAARSRQEVTTWSSTDGPGLSTLAKGNYYVDGYENKILEDIGITHIDGVYVGDKLVCDIYKGYYNFYCIGTGSGTLTQIYRRGLNYARGYQSGASPLYYGSLKLSNYIEYNMPWDTEAKAITGGGLFIAGSYIGQKQDTLYFQKFNYNNPGVHQYMQNLKAPLSESGSTYNAYIKMESLENSFSFKIPVYSNMPDNKIPRPEDANKISSLSIDGYQMFPVFDPSYEGQYSVTVPDTIDTAAINAKSFSDNAVISIIGNEVLAFGENVFVISCTPTSGLQKNYTLIINRSLPPKSKDNYLIQLGIDGIQFDKEFDLSFLGPYNTTVPYEITEINIFAAARSETSNITGAGIFTLAGGANEIMITVTAENGNSRIYKINVERIIPKLTSNSYKMNNGVASGINPSTTVNGLKSKIIVSAGTLKVFDSTGAELSATSNVGTGDLVRLYYNDKIIEEYIFIVFGDVNGDGKVNSTDMAILKSHRLRIKSLTGNYLYAADVNKDGKANSTDYAIIKSHILRIKQISQIA